MNKKLIIFGILSLIGWIFITILSFGLPDVFFNLPQQTASGTFSFSLTGPLLEIVEEMKNGFYYDVNNNDMPTAAFLIIFTILFWIYFGLIKIVEGVSLGKKDLVWIVFIAVMLRLAAVGGVLIHENDIYRYLWDGKVANSGINPYKYAPSDLFMYEQGYDQDHYDSYYEVTFKAKDFDLEDDKRLERLIALKNQNKTYFSRIGHSQVPTIYPPVTQLIFMLSAKLKVDSLLLMKMIFLLFDIGVIFVIIGILKELKLNPSLCIVYGWSPLVIMQLSNAGHYDAVVIFLTMLSILLAIRSKNVAGTVTLALASLTKFFSGVLLPFLFKFKKRLFFLFALTFCLFYLPYILWDDTGLRGVFVGLSAYNKEWAYNASIFSFIYVSFKSLVPAWTSYYPAKITCAFIYFIFLYYLWKRPIKGKQGIVKKCFWAIAILFIINPVGDPWYYCWVIPFLCIFRYRSWIMLSWLLCFSYLNFHSDIAFLERSIAGIPLISYFIYLPFYCMLGYEILKSELIAERSS